MTFVTPMYLTFEGDVRAFVAMIVKIMSFYHIKSLFYYFFILFYNILFIRCFIFIPLYLK